MPNWKKVIVSGSDAALNSLNVTTSLTASGNIYPTGLGVDRQILKTDGAGNISFGYAEEIVAIVKNVSGGTLQKGTPVHATASGASGNVVGIIAASASDASTMPATFVLNETLNDGDEGEALSSGFIQAVNTSMFEVGQIVYVGVSGGYTGTKPTGSNLIQNLGIVTKVGLTNGSGYILGAGRSNDLPNIQPGYMWVGNANSVPTPTATSSIQNVVSASYALSASYAPGGGAAFPFIGNAQISGSLGVTGSFSVLDSIDSANKMLIGSGPLPGSTKDSIDWQYRQLKNINADTILNWRSGVSITGSFTISGSSTFTNIGPACFSGSFVVQGDKIPGFPPFIPDVGPYDAIKVDDVNNQRKLYGSPQQGASASIDFGNRTLHTRAGGDALNWSGQSGTYETYLYNQQYIAETNRSNLFGNNSYGGQVLGDSYFNAAVMDNDLVYLNPDGQWYQVDQTTNSSTKMLGIAKNIFSQTGSVIIEGDVVVSNGAPYPVVDNPGYGLPIYIKSGSGHKMDTTVPASGYVRIVGHCYWNSGGGGGNEWIMKFRPSNDWVIL